MNPRHEVTSEVQDARLRIAIVGSGPSGLYALRSLIESANAVSVDVFDQLPAPYGLVRYGVAPDNQKMKSVIRVLRGSFDENDTENTVRFLGNVVFGPDISRSELRTHYDAVIYATGSQGDRRLGIPGEDLPGSEGAQTFVNWYCGHPDAAKRDFGLQGPGVAVVGAGNVALDVTRLLAKSTEEIAATDVPDRVLEAFRDSRVTDVHLLARRGPAQAKFTPVELREMGALSNADIVIDPTELVVTAADEERAANNRQLRQNLTMLREWAERPLEGKPRRVHMRFLRSPVRMLGSEHVSGLVVERNELREDGSVHGTGEYETLDVSKVLRAVGYQAQPLPGVPFDTVTATVPHSEGRVLDEHGTQQPGEYVTGWAKRGPTGVIGTNKNDAAETVRSLLKDLADRANGPAPENRDPAAVTHLLEKRGVDYVNWSGWLRLDSHEVELGAPHGRPRVKIPDRDSMLEISRGTGPDTAGA